MHTRGSELSVGADSAISTILGGGLSGVAAPNAPERDGSQSSGSELA